MVRRQAVYRAVFYQGILMDRMLIGYAVGVATALLIPWTFARLSGRSGGKLIGNVPGRVGIGPGEGGTVRINISTEDTVLIDFSVTPETAAGIGTELLEMAQDMETYEE